MSATQRSDRTRLGFVAIVVLLIGAASVRSWAVVEGLRWTPDLDLVRNIASGVAFRDGHILADPHYAGVPAWYSPLTSALLAFASLVTSVPINRLVMQGGVFVNVLTPVALTWVVTRWFGRRVALGTLVAFLFVMGVGFPHYVVVEYTPYLLAPFYSFGLFILALSVVPAAINRGSGRDAALLGLAGGGLALAHPGVIMLLAGVVAVEFVRAGLRATNATRVRLLRAASIAAAVALVVSAPFWLPVLVKYQGRIANEAPSTSVWLGLHSSVYWNTMSEFFFRWPMLIIAIGLPLWLVARRRHSGSSRVTGGECNGSSIVTVWTIVALIGLPAAAYRPEWFPLPSYHFLYYSSAALCVWFGISLSAIVDAVFGRLRWRGAAAATGIVVVMIAAVTYPRWYDDSEAGRRDALRFRAHFNDLAAVDWIRQNTDSDDVFINAGGARFLSDGLYIQFFPGMAGRHSVNIDSPEFSSPWVDWNKRVVDAQTMISALESCQLDRFEQLASAYGRVRYVLVPARSRRNVAGASCRHRVPVAYRDDGVVIQRIDEAGARQAT
jgi:hypothetical protein